MWCAVPGLHEHVSMVLRKEYSLAELMVGEIETEAIAELKYASGVSVGTKRAEKIKKSAMMPSTHIKILAEIPGVSKAAAERILNSVDEGMISLYFMELDEIRNLQKTDKTKVGPKLAEKIKKFMELA